MREKKMILFDEAYKIVMNSARQLPSENAHIHKALNRILAEDIIADTDMPPFNKSAMDGYACKRADLNKDLTVLETIQAGILPTKEISSGCCSKIMTGSVMPKGADCVIMVEYTERIAENKIRFIGKNTADNLCKRGEDVRVGDKVIAKGTLIQPQHIAILATFGYHNPLVSCRPKVGIIATGNELVEPKEKPSMAKIRNSNSYQLYAQTIQAGAKPIYFGIAYDTEQSTENLLDKAFAECDVVLLSGGVSMGDFDVVPDVLKKKDIKILFDGIAVKPGRPTVFGKSEKVFCFGLPGNPVSTFTIFELIVKPFLHKSMGRDFIIKNISAPLEDKISRKNTEREVWLPVCITSKGTVKQIAYHGSGHSQSLVYADGLIVLPVGVSELEKGALVNVRQI